MTFDDILRSDDIILKRELLTKAVKDDQINLIQSFLDEGLLPPNLLDHVMMEALRSNSVPIIKVINPHIDSAGCAMLAVTFRKPDILLFLGSHGFGTGRSVALVFLCQYGHLEYVKTLLNLGEPLHLQAFIAACEQGHLDIVHFLIDNDNTDLTEGLCGAIEHHQSDVINFLINLNKPIDYTRATLQAVYTDDHNLVLQMLTLAGKIDPEELSYPLEYACSKGHHKIVWTLLNLKVPLSSEVYSKVNTYDIFVKDMLLRKLRFSNLSSGIIRELLPDMKVLTTIKRLQKTWRRQRLNKASLRMNLIKDELQAVVYSPERLSHLLPQRVIENHDHLIKRAVISLRPIFRP